MWFLVCVYMRLCGERERVDLVGGFSSKVKRCGGKD